MQNINSNKKTTLQNLRRGWGLCPNSSLHENPVAIHTKKASWGRTDSRIPASLVRKLQLQFNRCQAQAHKASTPLKGRVRGRSGCSTCFFFFLQLPQLCLVCAGAEAHTSSSHLWSCKTEKNIKKCFCFFFKFPPKRFCNLLFKLIYSFRKIHNWKDRRMISCLMHIINRK